MKLVINQAELLKLINSTFNLDLKWEELTIEKVCEPAIAFEKALLNSIELFGDGKAVHAHQKIAAIKHLREAMMNVDCGRKQTNGSVELGIGLAQAKYAVEFPTVAIAHFKTHGVPMNYLAQ